MDINGRFQNGVVVLDGGLTMPDGTPVIVTLPASAVLPPRSARPRKRIVFPIIPSENPGSWDLSAEQIAEILDQEDASA